MRCKKSNGMPTFSGYLQVLLVLRLLERDPVLGVALDVKLQNLHVCLPVERWEI